MNRLNKKTVGGIILAAILVTATFTLPTASADLTALDKIGTIINIITGIQNTVNNIETIVLDIQNTVNNIFSEVTDPEHGLAEIKREVRNIEGNVTSPDFGLEEIKNEVRGIEGNVTSPDFGLEEIKNELLVLKYLGPEGKTFDTTFPNDVSFFISCDKNFVVASIRVNTSSLSDDDDFLVPTGADSGGFFVGHPHVDHIPDAARDPSSGTDLEVELINFYGTLVGVKGGDSLLQTVRQEDGAGSADTATMDAVVSTQNNAICDIT